jgi:hypothetical protein
MNFFSSGEAISKPTLPARLDDTISIYHPDLKYIELDLQN